MYFAVTESTSLREFTNLLYLKNSNNLNLGTNVP